MARVRMTAQARRAQLLAEAAQILARSGYQGLSVLELAERTGLSRAGVLHHIGSKEQLLVDLLAARDRVHIEGLGLRGNRPDPDIRRKLDDAVRRNLEQPELVRLYAVLSAEALDPRHPAHDYFLDRLAYSSADLAPHLQGFDREGRLVAVEILAFMDGIQLNGLRDPTIDVWSRWTAFADALFAGRSASATRPGASDRAADDLRGTEPR